MRRRKDENLNQQVQGLLVQAIIIAIMAAAVWVLINYIGK